MRRKDDYDEECQAHEKIKKYEHISIVKMLDSFSLADNMSFIILEFADGGTL